MWRNYLIVGLRSLAKNRAYALINILGLAIGMAACLMILLFVRYERSYDASLPGAENAYQVQSYIRDRDTGEEMRMQMAAYAVKEPLRKDFPQIEDIVHMLASSPVLLKDGIGQTVEEFRFTDGNPFRILQFPFVQGDAEHALDHVGSIVITETQATRWFGTENPMGRTLSVVVLGKPVDFRVTGILRDLPKNSHVQIDMVARYDPQSFFADTRDFLTHFGWQGGWVYARLKPGTDVAALNAQLPAWEKRNIPDEYYGSQKVNQGDETDYRFVNIRDVHLGDAQRGAMTPGNSAKTIATFAVIALLILGMACVNFINLATARASQRAREVALRKVLGASRRQLITQFIGESMLVATIAMLLALALVELALPAFNAFLDADIALRYFGSHGLLLPIVALILIVGAAGGTYPAFYLSRFQPAKVLKANKSATDAHGSGRLRNILVVGQFAVSIALIICTAVIYAQTLFARTVDPGYDRDNILQIQNISRRQMRPIVETLAREVERVPGVLSVGRSSIGIATTNSSNSTVQIPGSTNTANLGNYQVDPGFFRTMGIKLLAGRTFDKARPMDNATIPFPADPVAEQALVARGANIVVNALAVKRLGFGDPQAAIGRQVLLPADPRYGGVTPATIIGVVADSRFRSIREPIEPIAFRYYDVPHEVMLVRYSGDPATVRAGIEAVWKRLARDVPFEARFSEDIIGKLYAVEEARARMFAAFAVLAVVVGCLGLFGLATFTAERRTKEIGIRKVLGARTRDIVRLLVWQFSQPVLIANLIAWPVAWWVMRDWLNGFDSRITLGPAPFILAGLLALVIAVATIAGHAWRVARANPIHALRYE